MKVSLIFLFFFPLAVFSASASEKRVYADGNSEYGGFVFAADNSNEIPLKTTFTIEAEEEALHVRVLCETPDTAVIAGIPRGKDGTWPKGEKVELFLDPSGIGRGYIHICAGANGMLYDSRAKNATSYEPPQYRISFESKSWILDIRLQYSSPGMRKPQKGERWKFNICRTVFHAEKDWYYSTFAHVGSNFHNPGKFAELYFGSRSEIETLQKKTKMEKTAKLETELKRKGYASHFAGQIKRLREGGPESMIQEIYDELYVLERINVK